MRKMWNLMVNEHIKAFSKISTIIMVIAIIGLSVLYNLVMHMGNQTYYSDEYYQSYDQQISDAKAQKYEGWEDDVKALEFLRDNNIEQGDPWRRSAAYEVSNMRKYALEAGNSSFKAVADNAENAVLSSDWKSYYQEYRKYVEKSYEDEVEKDLQLWEIDSRLKYDIEPKKWNEEDWKNTLINNIYSAKITYNSEMAKDLASRDNDTLNDLEEIILIGEYRLENNIEVNTQPDNEQSAQLPSYNMWTVFGKSVSLMVIISVLIIIVAGGIFSSEFSAGTIKFLLINPVKRWKIFVSKYLTLIIISLSMLIIFYLFNGFLASAFFGFEGFTAPYLHVVNGAVQTGSSWLFIAWKYLLGSISPIVITTFAFMISSLVRNSALSIGLSVFLMLSGTGIVQFLGAGLGLDWARYIIFANTDLNAIIERTTPFFGHTVPFALCVIAVYMVVFLLTAWDAFMRRDIK